MKTEFEQEQEFLEMLDECYPSTTIGGITFYPSHIVKYCDPIAYREWLLNWIDDEENRGE
jgi:hypothetical protein